ncbi:MAG TPA: DUF1043 family protein [Gammaproteobacteria bacterium]|nr:DUF1043 family protein [Gammaproteobacteria bacterium]HRP86103.1 DUF1043 family protein [Gammaproteobacteria bacterium]
MGTVGWLLVVAVGMALGYSVGRLWPGSAARITALQRERDAAREDLRIYREEVSRHFQRTAELFDKVTADYRGLYEHLATSARQLGAIRGEAVDSRLARPEQRRLAEVAPPQPPAAEPGPAPEPEPAADESSAAPAGAPAPPTESTDAGEKPEPPAESPDAGEKPPESR